MVKIKLLCAILDAGFDKKISNILNKFGIRVKTLTGASGTASSSVLGFFGLAETKKDVCLAVVPEIIDKKILEKINVDFQMIKEGTGIAFTIPISSANKFLSDTFSKYDEERNDEEMEEENTCKYHLVLTIVMEGYIEQVMTAAKRAGTSGGTVIKGRGLANNKAAKILGFNIEPERDIILNIVREEDKNRVMEEITKEVGIKTPGKGICIALPVEDAVGLEIY